MNGLIHRPVVRNQTATSRGVSLALAALLTAVIVALLASFGVAPASRPKHQKLLLSFDLPPPPPPPPPQIVPPPKPVAIVRAPKQENEGHTRLPAAPAPTALGLAATLPRPLDVMPSPISTVSLAAALPDLGTGGNGIGTGEGKGAATGSGDGSGRGSTMVLTLARWVKKPSVEDMEPYNPDAVLRAHVVGDVLMMCRVRLNRHVHACRVLIEQPKGYGLGMAAVQASEMFRVLPADRGGRPIDDAWVGVPVHYDLTAHKH